MVFQDPTASLNPRQTIYEIVAEGLRIHRIHRGPAGEAEEELVARALSRAGLASAGTVLPPVPARAVGRPATARGDRRGARARARGDRGRRARLQPRRLGPGRDPQAADEAPRRRSDLDRRRHARSGSRVDDRRSRRRDVPRADRRDRTRGGRPHAPAASLHQGLARCRARDGGDRPTDPVGRAARPDARSPQAAASTRAVPRSPRAPRRPPASRLAAAARTSGSSSSGPPTSRRATWRRPAGTTIVPSTIQLSFQTISTMTLEPEPTHHSPRREHRRAPDPHSAPDRGSVSDRGPTWELTRREFVTGIAKATLVGAIAPFSFVRARPGSDGRARAISASEARRGEYAGYRCCGGSGGTRSCGLRASAGRTGSGGSA